MNKKQLTRREFMGSTGAILATVATGSSLITSNDALANTQVRNLPRMPKNVPPAQLARNELFWSEIASHYDRTQGIVNLEHGYWGKMSHSVQSHYLDAIKMVNQQNSFYARKDYGADAFLSVSRIAKALGVEPDEIVLTRNASEAIHNLIRQYRGLEVGDAVLYADIDYPSFKSVMHWLGKSRGVSAVQIDLPVRASQKILLEMYIKAFDDHPHLKLMLLTHVSNQHGLVLPVKAISKEARKRGIDIICDNAQSWGLLDYKLADLDIKWAGLNLHKWIGAPVGVGALYMKRGSLDKIAPYPGEKDPTNVKAATRIHMATTNFAAMISVPAALDFHDSIGAANKEARLRYLRRMWTDESYPNFEILGGADEASWTGMASFRLHGKTTVDDAKALQQVLENDYGIFSVIRKGLASGACVRITPQVFNTADDIGKLVDALKKIKST